jgi:hypothetical protein
MSNEQNQSDTKAHPVDTLVMVRCACGVEFGREKKYFDMYEDCKTNFPNAATFYKRKIELCDACHEAKIRKALGALPKVIEAIAGAL